MVEFDKLKEIVEECAADIAKFDGGNKAAGTRVRKAMQDIKKQAQEVRQAVMKEREVSVSGINVPPKLKLAKPGEPEKA